jgi:hypothetical protein
MSLPSGFRFSQSSLQDYVDCKRRFQLRYIEKLAWPAIESEPVLQHELFMQHGRLFHQLAHQYLIGIPAERLVETIADDQLMTWWERFVEFATHIDDQSDIQIQNTQRFPEITLIAPLLEYQLQAKYDLLLKTEQDTFIILDWKTNRVHPKQTQLAKRLQTRVYPFLLVKAGEHFNQGKEIGSQPSRRYPRTRSQKREKSVTAGSVIIVRCAIEAVKRGIFLSRIWNYQLQENKTW